VGLPEVPGASRLVPRWGRRGCRRSGPRFVVQSFHPSSPQHHARVAPLHTTTRGPSPTGWLARVASSPSPHGRLRATCCRRAAPSLTRSALRARRSSRTQFGIAFPGASGAEIKSGGTPGGSGRSQKTQSALLGLKGEQLLGALVSKPFPGYEGDFRGEIVKIFLVEGDDRLWYRVRWVKASLFSEGIPCLASPLAASHGHPEGYAGGAGYSLPRSLPPPPVAAIPRTRARKLVAHAFPGRRPNEQQCPAH
jgi:hypothetical protein